MPKHHLGELELLVLLALLRLGPDAYGVSISREIEETGRRSVALGSVYAALERLQSAGFVISELGEATAARGGKAKRYYRITATGKQQVRATRDTLVRMWKGVPAMGSIG